jgi:hypothetical protein
MQHTEQRPIGYERLGISGQLLQELAPQGFEEAPELPHAPMERRGCVAPDPGQKVREEPLAVAQERPLGLHAAELLQKRQGQDLGIREPLQGFVEAAARVEEPVGLIGETKKRGHTASSVRRRRGVGWGRAIRGSFRRGFGWPPLYRQSMQHSSRGGLTLSTAPMMPSLHEMTQLRRITLPRTPVNRLRQMYRASPDGNIEVGGYKPSRLHERVSAYGRAAGT